MRESGAFGRGCGWDCTTFSAALMVFERAKERERQLGVTMVDDILMVLEWRLYGIHIGCLARRTYTVE